MSIALPTSETSPLPPTSSSQLSSPPARAAFGHLGWLRSSVGCALGIAIAGLVGSVLLGTSSPALPWLMAPVGASAVLVFGLPASPLAQPWSVIGGSVLSGIIGLLLGNLLGSPLIAATIAIGLAIAVMNVTNCLHPPGGACALVYALGAAGPEAWGATHLLTIMTNVLALSAVAWCYNRATGHSWPHRAPVIAVAHRDGRSAQVHSALTAVLAEWDEVIDADIEDLDAIFLAVERRIRSREQDAPQSTEA